MYGSIDQEIDMQVGNEPLSMESTMKEMESTF